MEGTTGCGSWILCVGALLASTVRSDLSIRGCEHGSVDAVEGTDPVFTCGKYWIQGPQWTVYNNEGQEVYSGSCSKGTCTPWDKQFQLHEVKHEQRYMYTSMLTIKNITRDSARKLVCSNYSTQASCDLRIIAPAILKDCDVSIRDWRVEARCVVEHMYTSDGRYSCTWRVNNAELTSYFQDGLTAYWLNTRAYLKGVCSSNHTMPNSARNYTYSILIDPGVWTTVQTLNIEHPGDPMYTCHDVVQEGYSVTCKCTSSKPGNPPADFFWDERNTDTLYLYNVQREDSGKKHICFMTWGPNSYISRQAVLTLTVVVPVSIVPNSCSVQLSGWNVSGVCTVQWLPLLIKKPTCIWILKSKENTEEIPAVQSIASYKLTDPIHSINCSFVHQIPVIKGNYTYSNHVSLHPADQFSKSIYIEYEEDNTTTSSYQISSDLPPQDSHVLKQKDTRVQESIIYGGVAAVVLIAVVGVSITLCIKRRKSKHIYIVYPKLYVFKEKNFLLFA